MINAGVESGTASSMPRQDYDYLGLTAFVRLY